MASLQTTTPSPIRLTGASISRTSDWFTPGARSPFALGCRSCSLTLAGDPRGMRRDVSMPMAEVAVPLVRR